MNKIKAFILAAGYGERLKPLTDHIPKPLLPVLGKPVIEIVLEKMAGLPVDEFGINIHHKPEMLFQWSEASKDSKKIKLFHEKTIMGTGGALRNAEHFLSRTHFIVHNADIISDIPVEKLLEEHVVSGNIATLAVHDFTQFNSIWIDDKGTLKLIKKDDGGKSAGLCKIAFTGIAIYSPDFLSFLPEGHSSVLDGWMKALDSGKRIGTVDFSGCSWTDIGTPEAYAAAVFAALKKSGETVYAHPSVNCSGTTIKGYVICENGCTPGSGTSLKNCILLPETRLHEGSRIENSIAGPDYIIRIRKAKGTVPSHISQNLLQNFFLGATGDLECELIGTGGSDRKYYRLQTLNRSAVLMSCSQNDPDYERHIAATAFFRKKGMPVPILLESNDQERQALFEDLGDLSLYAWLQCRRDPELIERMYRSVLDILIQLQTSALGVHNECPLLADRVFDYEHLRWESSYFVESFLKGHLGITIRKGEGLDQEFRKLAETVEAFPTTLLHRDFQSQNIMIPEDGLPRIIDYQGARIGPPAYDLASVLWDPYFMLEDAMRERLIMYYLDAAMPVITRTPDEDAFRYSLLMCRLQRHMQALGAYAFLSNRKNKKYFLKYIPRAVRYLEEETARACEEYPVLHELAKELRSSCGREMSTG